MTLWLTMRKMYTYLCLWLSSRILCTSFLGTASSFFSVYRERTERLRSMLYDILYLCVQLFISGFDMTETVRHCQNSCVKIRPPSITLIYYSMPAKRLEKWCFMGQVKHICSLLRETSARSERGNLTNSHYSLISISFNQHIYKHE